MILVACDDDRLSWGGQTRLAIRDGMDAGITCELCEVLSGLHDGLKGGSNGVEFSWSHTEINLLDMNDNVTYTR